IMKISVASDHAGFAYKQLIAEWLKQHGHQILDFGAFSEESVDYPDYALPSAESVAAGIADFGVLICGTGTGMSITANKVTGIRAASCVSEEMAIMARKHNNANIVTFGSRLIDIDTAKRITKAFLEEEFEGGRHMIRVEKIHSLTGW
ncbi:MAG: ribose 5-phosphate isomerase B, partial [Bacteroidota bacterium]